MSHRARPGTDALALDEHGRRLRPAGAITTAAVRAVKAAAITAGTVVAAAASWVVLQADHGTNPKKRNADGKAVSLSDYKWWPYNGGVAAMREEAKH